jgi:ATP-dependent phosphofructokinase / diphosphate-dependent phosphofructokinase
MAKNVGVLTAGSDSPGLNAAIRAIGRAANSAFGRPIIAFHDGFKGLVEDQTVDMQGPSFSGILTSGGTVIGTSRDVPHRMLLDGKNVDRTDEAVETYHRHKLDVLVCLGGRETQDTAYKLMQRGLNVITLPKAIDNDIAETETTVGFDTALETAAEAIDRVHATALSNHRILIVEIMGRSAGWLTLGAGIAGGADVILIPEIPYQVSQIIDAITDRNQAGKRFSIIAVSEGALSQENAAFFEATRQANNRKRTGADRERIAEQIEQIQNRRKDNVPMLASRLEHATGLETRTIILGYLLRGGVPSSADRLLATQLGSYCVSLIQEGKYGVMVGLRNGRVEPVALEKVQGRHKLIPLDHPWITSARQVGTNLGD